MPVAERFEGGARKGEIGEWDLGMLRPQQNRETFRWIRGGSRRSFVRMGLNVSDDAIREAHAARGMFNAIDPDSG